MAEFEVAGHTYRSGKMNAWTQIHVLRRAAPIVGPIQSLSTGAASGEAFVVLANAIASLSDDAMNYILENCLDVVERKQGEAGWAKIKVPNTQRFMFVDIGMREMLAIASHVMRDNYFELFQGGLSDWNGGAKD